MKQQCWGGDLGRWETKDKADLEHAAKQVWMEAASEAVSLWCVLGESGLASWECTSPRWPKPQRKTSLEGSLQTQREQLQMPRHQLSPCGGRMSLSASRRLGWVVTERQMIKLFTRLTRG